MKESYWMFYGINKINAFRIIFDKIFDLIKVLWLFFIKKEHKYKRECCKVSYEKIQIKKGGINMKKIIKIIRDIIEKSKGGSRDGIRDIKINIVILHF